MSSPSGPTGECDRLRKNLQVHLERWWKASNAASFGRYGRKAEDTYRLFSAKCPGALQIYEKMLAEVMKLPKGGHIRDTEYREKHGGHGRVVKLRKK